MKGTPGIRKYYIGFGVLMIIVLVALVSAFSKAGDAKTDAATNKTVEQIGTKLDSYTLQNSAIPDSLKAAGVSESPQVTYTKIGNTSYKICIDYKTATSGFDAGWGSLIGGVIGQGAYDDSSLNSNNNTYFDTSVTYTHKKGQNCQTVKPDLINYNSYNSPSSGGVSNPGVYTNCDTYSNLYPARRTAKIKSVDTTNHIIYLDPSYVQNYQNDSGFQSTTNLTSITYNSNTTFYDDTCQKIDASNLIAGDRADFYVSSQTDTFAGQVEVVATGASILSQ